MHLGGEGRGGEGRGRREGEEGGEGRGRRVLPENEQGQRRGEGGKLGNPEQTYFLNVPLSNFLRVARNLEKKQSHVDSKYVRY